MPGGDLEVVLIYEQLPEHLLGTIRQKMRYWDEESKLVEKDRVSGLLAELEADAGYLGSPDLPLLTITSQEANFEEAALTEDTVTERVESLVDIVRDVYFACDERPGFVYAIDHHTSQAITEIETPPVDAASLAENRINYAVWLNVFPPSLVETYGRETLLSAPAWRTEEWDDGSVLVVAYEDPLALDSLLELNEHLGLEDPFQP